MDNRGSIRKVNILIILLTAVLTGIDQITKVLAVNYIKGHQSIALIPGFFHLAYLENHGAAWGILKDRIWLFLILTVIILFVIIRAYRRTPYTPHFTVFRILCASLTAGALGNAFDRIFRGYVVDFLYIKCIDFPVFNVADMYVTCSLILGLLIYRKEVLEWIRND